MDLELQALERWFQRCPGALVAFSGGVDSSLIAFLARRFLGKASTLALVSASPSLKISDLEEAKDFAQVNDIPLQIVLTREIENPNYFNNPDNRCYFCKHTLYDHLSTWREKHPNWWIVNGTNADDSKDYRPGLKAADEFQVHSPLADCGVDKKTVREISSHFELSCWNKPASPCLASRIPYGQRVTTEKLEQIESAEAFLSKMGFPINRVRHFNQLARIEVSGEHVDALEARFSELEHAFRSIGFEQVEIDAEGFVSGKLNRAILSKSVRQ